MSSDLFFEGKKFISSRRAADLCAYTQDYVGQLIRSGKLEAKMVGRNWFVAEESILAYKRLADESSKTLFQKTDEAISASRDASEHEAVEAVEAPVVAKAPEPVVPEVTSVTPVVREEAYVGLVYMQDERSSLPELKKTSVRPVAKAVVELAVPEVVQEVAPEPVVGVVSPFIYEESIEDLGGDFGMIDIGRKVLAAALSLSLVLGSYYMADAERSRSFLSSTEAVGSRMSLAVTDTFTRLATSVGVVKDAYLAAVHNAGVYAVEGVVAFVGAAEDVVSLYGDAVETVGRRSSDASDVLASVSIPDTARTIAAQIRVEGIGSASLAAASTAGGSLVSGLESVAVGVYEAINPIFSRTGSFLAGLFAPKDTVLVIDTPAPIAPQPEPQRETVAVVSSPVVLTQPAAQPVTQVSNTYYQTSGLSAADVTALVDRATADLEAQVAQAQLDALRANENARNATDRGSRYDLDRITIRRSDIKDSRMTGSTIADSRIENSTLVNANLTGTTTAGLIAAESITADSITFSNSNIQNSTTTNATSTNLFASTFAADRLQVAGSTGVTVTSSGLVGIGTSTPEAQLAIAQITNGLPMLSARRVTDIAPSGDFINYRSADGGTVLFRVDNSGNLLAGGIITTGSYTVTSTSTPQFRVQYDSSAEMTTMVASTGASVIAVNGSNPSVSFVPQSNGTSTFSINDASNSQVLSVDTANRVVSVDNLVAGGATTTNSTSTNFYAQSLAADDSALGNATSTNFFSTFGRLLTGTIDSLSSTIASIGDIFANTLVVTNSTTTNATSTNLYAQSLAAGDSVFGNATSTNFGASTISAGDIIASGALTVTGQTNLGDVNFTAATSTGLLSASRFAATDAAGTSSLASLVTSGRLGVGTTSPNEALTVNGAVYLSGTNPVIRSASTTRYLSVGMIGDDSLPVGGYFNVFGRDGGNASQKGSAEFVVDTTNNPNAALNVFGYTSSTWTNRFTLRGDGRLGIGTTTPSSMLSLVASTTPSGGIALGDVQIYRSAASALGLAASSLNFAGTGSLTANGQLNLTAGNTRDMVHTVSGGGDFEFSGGNVGIGTTSPSARLDVYGAATFGTSSTPLLYVDTANNGVTVGGNTVRSRFSVIANDNGGYTLGSSPYYSFYPSGMIDVVRGTATSSGTALTVYDVTNASGGNQQSYIGSVSENSTANAGAAFVVGRRTGATTWAESLRVNSSGNVGIGTSTPGYLLQINNAAASTFRVGAGNTTGSYFDVLGTQGVGGSGVQATLSRAGNDWNTPATLNFNTNGTNAFSMGLLSSGSFGASFAIGTSPNDASPALVINSSKNVGIGTTSPTQKLSVLGNIQAEGGTASIIVNPYGSALDNNSIQFSSGRAIFGYDSVGTSFAQASAGRDFRVLTNSTTEVARFTSGGNVGIGTTTPAESLTIQGGVGVNPFLIASSTGRSLFNVSSAGNVIVGNSVSPSSVTIMMADGPGIGSSGQYGPTLNIRGSNVTNLNQARGGPVSITGGSSSNTSGGGFVSISGGVGFGVYGDVRLQPSGGNVGIGTTTPSNLLTLYSTAASGSSNNGITIQNNSANGFASLVFDRNRVGGVASGAAIRLQSESAGTQSRLEFVTNTSNGFQGVATSSSRATMRLVSTGAGDDGAYLEVARFLGASSADGTGTLSPQIRFTSVDSSGNNEVQYGRIGALVTASTTGASTGDLQFFSRPAAGLAERMRITSDGNVGIGTSTPQDTLSVVANANTQAGITISNVSTGNSARAALSFDAANGGSTGFFGAMGSTFTQFPAWADSMVFWANTAASGGLVLGASGGNPVRFMNSTSNEAGRFDSNGNFGIGTTTPVSKLTVSGTASSIAQMDITSTDTGVNARFYSGNIGSPVNANGALFGTQTNHGFHLMSNNLVRMTVAADGNVGIGTTTPSTVLAVVGTTTISGMTGSGVGGLYFDNGGSAQILSITRQNAVASGDVSISGFSGVGITGGRSGNNPASSAYHFYVNSAGNVGIGSTTPSSRLTVKSNGDNFGLVLDASSSNTRLAGILQENSTSASLRIYDGGVEDVRITSQPSTSSFINNGGNFGIGTTTPANRLVVANTGGNTNIVAADTGASSISISSGITGSAGTARVTFLNNNTGYWGLGMDSGDPGTFRIAQSPGAGFGTTRLVIDSNGNVGIGTTTPNQLFVVNKAGSSDQEAGRFTAPSGNPYLTIGNGLTSTTGGYIKWDDANNIITMSAHGNSTLNVTSAGNVGIGTTSPAAPLTVFSTVANNAAGQEVLRLGAPLSGGIPGSGPAIVFANNAGTVENFKIRSGADASGSGRGNLTFSGGGATLATLSDLMTLTYAGNLGIGTTSPAAKLSVVGETLSSWFTATSTTATSSIAGSFDVGNGALRYNYGTGLTSIDNLQLGNLNFEADSGVVTWIDMPVTAASAAGTKQSYTASINGNPLLTVYSESDGAGGIQNSGVGIGTSTPLAKLDIWGNFRVSTSTSAASPLVFANTASGMFGIGTSSPTAQLHTTGTVRFSNFGSGTLTTDASGNVSVSSDERLKDISGRFTRGLEDIKKISPILYKWNATSGLDMVELYAGFSAQNVETAIPEAVGVNPNGFLSLNDRPILAASVNAIKELALSVASTTERVAGIESRVRSLELTLATAGVPEFVTASTSASSTIEAVTGWLASLGASIENAVARFVTVIADAISTKKLTVGDTSNLAASGITIFDRSTGQPVCMFVEGGVMKSEPGECGAQSQPSTLGSSTPEPSQQNPQPTQPEPPAPSEPSGETASTTPEVTDPGSTGTTTPEIVPEPTASTTPEVAPETQPESPQEPVVSEETVVPSEEPTPTPEQAPEASETPSEPAPEPEPTPVATE